MYAQMVITIEVLIGDVEKDQQVSVKDNIPFVETRSYRQVYFQYNNCKYKINKNNAQMNFGLQDDGKYVEITIRFESGNVDLDIVMDSENAFFYTTDFC